MLPGLMRTAATPASIARSARLALKWMSAITGIGLKRTIFGSASASSLFGTATRTTSQPALASAAICAVVAGTSCVFVSVIDCTTTGAPPPIVTSPTRTETSLATRSGYPRAAARDHGGARLGHDLADALEAVPLEVGAQAVERDVDRRARAAGERDDDVAARRRHAGELGGERDHVVHPDEVERGVLDGKVSCV